jgi:hypothetical protein
MLVVLFESLVLKVFPSISPATRFPQRMKSLSPALRALPFLLLGAAFPASAAVTPASFTQDQIDFFENKIRPILVNQCLKCHSHEKDKGRELKGEYSMDTRADLMKIGNVSPGDVKRSTLIKALEWDDELQMPPKKKLSDEEIADMKKWVEMGAPDPREARKDVKLKKDWWSFQKVTRPQVPEVKNAAWCKTSIDKFILAKLEKEDFLPAEPPETGTPDEIRRKKEALLRRAYFDLVGMPPSPDQIRDFINDRSPRAFEKVIDELQASPAYGERWARHWLDTARYSDTTGVVGNQRGEDYRYAYAWSYRDWVISAFNKDMPYDQFIMHQLAADKIPNNPKANLAALGFLTVGQRFNDKNDILNDRIDVVGRGFLGLTVACARCHEHKFDPITQADYYALKGVFASSVEPKEGPVIAGDENSEGAKAFQEKLETLEKRAYATVFQMEREKGALFREKAAAYFQAGYELRQRDDPDAQKRATAILDREKLNGRFLDDTVSPRISERDPVMGPFVQLITMKENRKDLLEAMFSGKFRGAAAYNAQVMEFLRNAGPAASLPSDLATVSALVEKFFRMKVDPTVGAKADRKADVIQDLAKGGIFKKIADPELKEIDPADRAVMEAAVFPMRLLTAKDITSVADVQKTIRAWGLTNGGELDGRSGINRINELKLTNRSGPVRAMVLEDLPKPVDSPIYPRGNPPKPEDNAPLVPRRFIEVLAGGDPEPFNEEDSGRYDLAKAIASKSNPLTARVMVNRVWMHLLGEGLVRTPDDLGNNSGDPSHQELLDYLSSWFMDDYGPSKPGWSIKALQKAIMTSSVYQQSSRTPHMARQKARNASNSLLWRANVRRLDFEAFRDALLTMSGDMDKTLFGPPVNLVSEPYSFRRSVYGYIDRGSVPDLLAQFDVASPLEPNTKRTSTIVPQQALFLMNSPFTIGVAQKVVKRREVVDALVRQKDTRAGILAIFQIVLQRTPSQQEFEMAYRFVSAEAKNQGRVDEAMKQAEVDFQKQAERDLRNQQRNEGARKAILNEGELVQRVTLSPWETLVQALMFCNEATYLN